MSVPPLFFSHLPQESVDIYEFNSSYYDLELKDSNIAITDNQIDLNLEAGVAQI